MTNHDQADRKRFNDWAASQLELPADFGADTLKRAVRRRIGEANFFPSPDCVEAYAGVGPAATQSLDAAHYFQTAERERLRTEIDAFAARFFDLPPDERRSEWQALIDASADDARLQLRLEALRAGLPLDLNNFAPDAPWLQSLARRCGELFVALPQERARRRRAILRERDDQPDNWRLASRLLSARRPDIAQLAPDLLRSLAENDERRAAFAANNRRWHERSLKAPVKIAVVRDQSTNWSWIWVALAAAGACLGPLVSASRKSAPNNYVAPSNPPQFTQQQSREAFKNFNRIIEAQRAAGKKVEAAFDKAAASGDGAPSSPAPPAAP